MDKGFSQLTAKHPPFWTLGLFVSSLNLKFIKNEHNKKKNMCEFTLPVFLVTL